jgi:predicted transcriptional regulator
MAAFRRANARVDFWTTTEHRDLIAARASEQGVSMSEFIRTGVSEYMATITEGPFIFHEE